MHISSEFRKFLDESSAFFERLNGHFRRCFDDDKQPLETRSKCRVSCHRCLIFLGDLARYRELHNQKSRKDFGVAEGLPVGLQIMGRPGSDFALLDLAKTLRDGADPISLPPIAGMP